MLKCCRLLKISKSRKVKQALRRGLGSCSAYNANACVKRNRGGGQTKGKLFQLFEFFKLKASLTSRKMVLILNGTHFHLDPNFGL